MANLKLYSDDIGGQRTINLHFHMHLTVKSDRLGERRPQLLKYQCNIKQTSDENKEKYYSGNYKLIQYQILRTYIIRDVWQTVRRITEESLELKGLKELLAMALSD